MKKLLTLTVLLTSFLSYSQSVYTQQTSDYNHFVDRYEILSGTINQNVHTSFKPYKRQDVVQMLTDSLFSDSSKILSKADYFNFEYIKDDNWDVYTGSGVSRIPVLKYFYKKKSALYAVDTKHFKLQANPVLYTWAGTETGNPNKVLFQNTRGVDLRGTIDNKVSFYTQFTDNQARLPLYVYNSISPVDTLKQVLMGENYLKVDGKSHKLDYISARGYINFQATKHIAIQFGHDKNFVGNGFRSLILSENSGTYNFLKIQTKVWKLQYTNLFCQLTATPTVNDSYFAKKYLTLHHLSMNVTKFLNIGLFESVVYGGRGLDINYLNPVIFYRSVEQNLGSSDNASLGADWKLNFMKHFSWYGQVYIDEFLIANLKARNGSWTNKQAVQLGLKYMNVLGVKNLDGQLEFNSIRPYTYAHQDNGRNYSNYLQPLAHPRGANLKEVVGILKYQPTGRLFITGKFIVLKQGLDSLTSTRSAGADILMSYSQRIKHGNQDLNGHKIGQGVAVNLYMFTLGMSYMFRHNMFLDLNVQHRQQNSAVNAYKYDENFYSLGLRINIAEKKYDW
ncbi:MAG: hypothetical protein U0V72_07515 [Cytophagales bacterium]